MSCEVPPPSLCCPKFLQLGLNDRAVKVEFKKALTRKTVTFAMSHLIRKQESVAQNMTLKIITSGWISFKIIVNHFPEELQKCFY